MIKKTAAALLILAGAFYSPALSQTSAGAPEQAVRLGYLELANDPRYASDAAYAGIVLRAMGRPFAGAEVGVEEANTIGRFIHISFEMAKASAPSADGLAEAARDLNGRGAQFILTDLPGDALADLSRAAAALPVTFFNVSAPDNDLRGARCAANVFHTAPSDAMKSDALAQFLATRRWRDVLVLKGPSARDGEEAQSFKQSAQKFGLRIVDERSFSLSRNPAMREENNVALLTQGANYDVVFVADDSNDYARYVPYRTVLPRPVVGDAGLQAEAWSWLWDRNGAPQLQHRFEKAAFPRRMNGAAWAAWAAVKAVAQAALRTRSADYATLKSFLSSEELDLDTDKGRPGSFRSWDRQLRQPILLATDSAVIATAPLPQFLHRTNVLDTLGADEPESQCRLR
ncbi:MAG TPA: ABC transporter substrate-binding protein [Roseiarcus sp.]|nr:ABC transporter substrate-binding protein [Roseiarcus sp.]